MASQHHYKSLPKHLHQGSSIISHLAEMDWIRLFSRIFGNQTALCRGDLLAPLWGGPQIMGAKQSLVHQHSPDYIKLHHNKKNHPNPRKYSSFLNLVCWNVHTLCLVLMQVPVITTQLIKLPNFIES